MKTGITALSIALFAGSAIAADQDITAIFGSGNADTNWTATQGNGIEIGLRAKLRFNDSNSPEDTFNSDNNGTYTFAAGLPPTGFGFAANSTSTATWNFEWSVNTDKNGTSNEVLSDYTYQISIDFDPGAGTNFLQFDPINQTWADHAIGDNSTANGAGTKAAGSATSPDTGSYEGLIDNNNIAQNSWNMEFFDNAGGGFPFDGRTLGEYTIMFEVFDSEGDLVGTNSILINVVPMPAASAMAGLGLIAVGTRRRR
jgi:hypothetical protein